MNNLQTYVCKDIYRSILMSKYKLTEETKQHEGITLYRIQALIDIPSIGVIAGDLGGWLESESNLGQDGNAWVCENALVCGYRQD